MPKTSAGLLMYRHAPAGLEVLLEVFLVHPGGPFWARKDVGAWFLPKGEVEPGEDELSAAVREFAEETGFASHAPFLPLPGPAYWRFRVATATGSPTGRTSADDVVEFAKWSMRQKSER